VKCVVIGNIFKRKGNNYKKGQGDNALPVLTRQILKELELAPLPQQALHARMSTLFW
jgi:hypothetical protein